jgi:hypothetical protein
MGWDVNVDSEVGKGSTFPLPTNWADWQITLRKRQFWLWWKNIRTGENDSTYRIDYSTSAGLVLKQKKIEVGGIYAYQQ